MKRLAFAALAVLVLAACEQLPTAVDGTNGERVLATSSASSTSLLSEQIKWIRQFGSPFFDAARGIAVDATRVYVTGQTQGTLAGGPSAGLADAFAREYDVGGNEVWTRQFGTPVGTPSTEDALAIAADATGLFVVGTTNGAFSGQTNAGGTDAFVRKYDVDGNEVWTRQFGTPGFDGARGISLDASGGVYVTGGTAGVLPGQTSAGVLTPLCASMTSMAT